MLSQMSDQALCPGVTLINGNSMVSGCYILFLENPIQGPWQAFPRKVGAGLNFMALTFTTKTQ